MHLATETVSLSESSLSALVGVGDEVVVFPDHVGGYADICSVLRQVRPNSDCPHGAQNFGIARLVDSEARDLAFAYFLGVMVGDMSKHANYLRTPPTMTALLQLSKRYESNLRFGNFVTYCAGMLGIRMRQIKDYIRPVAAPYDAYRWVSRQSRLVMWMFETCLGLREGETTTNDPIRADWLTRTSRQFQTWFLQGIADSDGYVDLNKHEIGIVVDPNEMLIATMLEDLGVRLRAAVIKNQATVLMSVKEGFALPIFSPYARTHKFELAKQLAEAKRFQGPWPEWLRNEVDDLLDDNEPSGKIVRTILDKYNIAIRSQHLKRPKEQKLNWWLVPRAGSS
jgi:hypothetical protein